MVLKIEPRLDVSSNMHQIDKNSSDAIREEPKINFSYYDRFYEKYKNSNFLDSCTKCRQVLTKSSARFHFVYESRFKFLTYN